MSESKTKGRGGLVSVAVDYAPLAIFLIVYRHYAPETADSLASIGAVIRGTVAFMIAAIGALFVSKWRLGRISPMLWLSTGLIVGFGGLTIFFGDPDFVQMKPTLIYLLFGASLLIAYYWKGKSLLRYLLEAAFEGVDDAGWLKLSRNWGVFFLFLAALNEGIRHFYNVENGNFEGWLWAKFWVFMPLSFLFTFTQIPMLLRHGLGLEAGANPTDN